MIYYIIRTGKSQQPVNIHSRPDEKDLELFFYTVKIVSVKKFRQGCSDALAKSLYDYELGAFCSSFYGV